MRKAIDWAVLVGDAVHCEPVIVRRRRWGRCAAVNGCIRAGVNLRTLDDCGVGSAWLSRRGRGPEWATIPVLVMPLSVFQSAEGGAS
jgi:hypothetical protein